MITRTSYSVDPWALRELGKGSLESRQLLAQLRPVRLDSEAGLGVQDELVEQVDLPRKLTTILDEHAEDARSAAFSPNGTMLAATLDNRMGLWKLG
ncbi:hypothetical protein AB0N06_38540 [Streptomyces sp. NPDC051020]|uniref:hypothetical protein n=1 Tax=Streptomyces sp. NPDC051020 TaxID=3155409 RepID=UPI00342F7039